MRLTTGILAASFAVSGLTGGCNSSAGRRHDTVAAYTPDQQSPRYNITCFDRAAPDAEPESTFWKARFEQRKDGDGIGTLITTFTGQSIWKDSRFMCTYRELDSDGNPLPVKENPPPARQRFSPWDQVPV
jgi:hypothetical protein